MNRLDKLNTNIKVLKSSVFDSITTLCKYCFIFVLLLLTLYTLYIIIYEVLSPIYCMANGDIDKKFQAASEVAKNVNASNNSVNVSNPEIHLHNPNIKVPSSLGTGIGMGGTISAGIYALSKSKGMASMPIGAIIAMVTAGGLAVGIAFVGANYANTIAQKNANSSSNTSIPPTASTPHTTSPLSNDVSDSYPAKSIIEEGDTVDNVTYYLALNILICIIVLLLFLLLMYLYIYRRDNIKRISFIWLLLMAISIYSLYLAYNLVEDVYIIARIYHNTNDLNNININYDLQDKTIQFLFANLISRFFISGILYLLLIFHVQNMIFNSNKEFKYIKNIVGERLYNYFVKSIKISGKTNWIWMILLIFCSILSIFFAVFIYNNIYDITELYLNSRK